MPYSTDLRHFELAEHGNAGAAAILFEFAWRTRGLIDGMCPSSLIAAVGLLRLAVRLRL